MACMHHASLFWIFSGTSTFFRKLTQKGFGTFCKSCEKPLEKLHLWYDGLNWVIKLSGSILYLILLMWILFPLLNYNFFFLTYVCNDFKLIVTKASYNLFYLKTLELPSNFWTNGSSLDWHLVVIIAFCHSPETQRNQNVKTSGSYSCVLSPICY